MTDLTLLPAELAELSVPQLAALSPQQKILLARQLEQAGDWLKQVKARFDVALEQTYGDRIRAARSGGGKDFGVVHVADGDLRLTVDVSKRVTWDQAQLAVIAKRIAAAGESVEEFIDVSYSISESRFQNWPSTLRSQFEVARTVKPGKPTYRLALAGEG
jgi:transposase-like protein